MWSENSTNFISSQVGIIEKYAVASTMRRMSEQKPAYPSRTADQFVIRLPDGMRDRLKEAAHANGRSMNSEIVSRLQSTLDSDVSVKVDMSDDPTLADEVAALVVKRLAQKPDVLAKLVLDLGLEAQKEASPELKSMGPDLKSLAPDLKGATPDRKIASPEHKRKIRFR